MHQNEKEAKRSEPGLWAFSTDWTQLPCVLQQTSKTHMQRAALDGWPPQEGVVEEVEARRRHEPYTRSPVVQGCLGGRAQMAKLLADAGDPPLL